MKRVLLLVISFVLSGYLVIVQAQTCSIGIPTVTNTSAYSTGDSCYAKFDLSFSMKNNSGNKTIGIDLWQAISYKRPTYNKAPTATELSGSLGTLVLDNSVGQSGSNISSASINVPVYSNYPFGTNVRLLSVKNVSRTYNATLDSFYFKLTEVVIAVPKQTGGTCPVSMLTIKGDVWSTNSGSLNSNTQVQCVSGLSFTLGNPAITAGFRNCTKPRTLDFRIETTSETPITVSYKIFSDDGMFLNNQLYFDPNLDQNVTINGEVTVADLSASKPYIGDDISFNNFDYPNDGMKAYWVVVYYTPQGGTTYSVSRLINNECSTLPVTFSNFHAQRNKQTVSLMWETATEQNNRGFNIQRNTKGVWENIAFVFSAADDGNSSSQLSYSYNDANNEKGISQYRIQQVDLDGKATYSIIRSVKGEELVSKTVIYPNPSSDGKVNVVFEDQSAKAVTISDLSGRVVRQYRNVINNLLIDGLESGMYSIQITDLSSAASTTEKVIIKKR